jgi:hypothetical protein
MFSNCKEKTCPGWVSTLLVGLAMVILVAFTAVQDAYAGEVRVEIKRYLPEETQLIVQQFHDVESFQMWMAEKMEVGCDPYVEEVKILLNYNPALHKVDTKDLVFK